MKNPSQKLETGDWQLVVLLLISVFHFLISSARLRAQQPQTPSLRMPDVRSWFVDPNTQGPTVRADLMPGSDGGAKIIACIASLPATGGTCDARGLVGAQNWSTVTISKDVTILLGCGVTFTYTGASSLFLITGSPQLTVFGCGSAGPPYSIGYGGLTGAATLFTFNPTGAATDAISADANSSPRLTLSGFRINGNTNTRDHVRLNGTQAMFVDIDKMTFSGPAGGGAYTSGYAVNFNAPGPAALDFSRIRQVQIGWTTGGIRYGNANTTGSLVDQSQFASIAGRAIVGEYGIGQMTISRNTFIGCNQVTAGGAVHLKPNAGYATSDITFIGNSYQGNGLAGSGSYDVYLDGTNGLVVGIHMLGEQFNDAGETGAYAEVYAINTDGLFLEHPHLSDGQSGGHSSGLYIDSTNTNVHYLRGHIDGSSTEFINSAGATWTSQLPNVFKVYAGTLNTVSFSSTPTFDASLGNTQTITLTGNVTSSTLSNARAGETINFVICQDSGGSHTFVWPTNVLGGMTIGSTASKCSAQSFIFNGTNAYALSTGAANM
ncbi:MAG: hypothetical protein ABSB82_02280 [Terriglobia bacterium]|jgi:hypothetical protein